MIGRLLVSACLVSACAVSPAQAQTPPVPYHRPTSPTASSILIGSATVIDGDTIVVEKIHIRLHGIDAPEIAQICSNGWPAGTLARNHLISLLKSPVSCTRLDTDRYGRTVARCRADGNDIAALMVSAGMAWAYLRYSTDYLTDQLAAQAAQRGVHSQHGTCELPWLWRRQRPTAQ